MSKKETNAEIARNTFGDSSDESVVRKIDLIRKGVPRYNPTNIGEARSVDLRIKGVPFVYHPEEFVEARRADLGPKLVSVAKEIAGTPEGQAKQKEILTIKLKEIIKQGNQIIIVEKK